QAEAEAVVPPVQAVENFANCTELRKVYPSGVGSDHPAYKPKHDRDNDGWACEITS
ncbi:MAG: excalibur calcium-binding domain-containing protein, partial [Culicoidibacterales bacterium]